MFAPNLLQIFMLIYAETNFISSLLKILLIFEFTLIYLLYVSFVLKIEDNLKRRKNQTKKGYFLFI